MICFRSNEQATIESIATDNYRPAHVPHVVLTTLSDVALRFTIEYNNRPSNFIIEVLDGKIVIRRGGDSQVALKIEELTDSDVGRRVYYVPKHVRNDPDSLDWIGHQDSQWGEIKRWTDEVIFVKFPDSPSAKACSPEDVFPEHCSNDK
jgi:hypothetical protein